MALEDALLNPSGGSIQNLMPMRDVDLKFLNAFEDQWRYSPTKALAAYTPVKLLPAMRFNKDAQAPIVMPAGTIVSVIPFKAAYAADETESGILATGRVAKSILANGDVAYEGISSFYDKSLSGLITVANGGTSATDNYTDEDGAAGVLSATGVAVATGQTYTRAANVPVGVVGEAVYGDLRGRWNNYTFGKSQYTIFRNGVMTVPYVIVYAAAADTAKVTAAVAALKAKLNPYHQFYIHGIASASAAADAKAAIATGVQLKPTEKGKFTFFVEGTDSIKQKVGTILELRNRVPYGLDEMIDSFPGSSIQGMDTAGLPTRLYHFLKNVMTVADASKANDKAALKGMLSTDLAAAAAGSYSGVTIAVGQVDIEIGFNR